MGNGTWTVYIQAQGPSSIEAVEHTNLLSSGNFGGTVVHVGTGRRPVSVVVEVDDASTENAAYERVLGKMRAALGDEWLIEPDPG